MRPRPTRPALRRLAAGATVTLAALAGCSSADDGASSGATATTSAASDAASTDGTTTDSTTVDNTTADSTTADGTTTPAGDDDADPASGDFFDGAIHSIEIAVDQADVDAAIDDFRSTGDKTWIEASVTIDGVTYDRVGMRLKGNSSLMSLLGGGAGRPGGGAGGPMVLDCATGDGTGATDDAGASSSAPTTAPAGDTQAASVAAEDLPWLIRLDEYVDDQQHQGRTDFVVRSNSTETALNEAVALELLDEAGLASQDSTHVRFSVNGSDATLRLVVELPDDTWAEEEFREDELGEGVLFQADAQGDYSYRGDDPAAYTEAWDHEAGEEDYQPLIDFLEFVNDATDEEFAAGLADRLDVESFARYLAFEDLIGNWDDIAGPGNNSYLYFDADGRATVVAWDHNLALNGGAGPGGMGGPGGMDGMPAGGGAGMPGGTLPDGAVPGGGAFPLPEGCLPPDLGASPDGAVPGDVAPGDVVAGPGRAPGGQGQGGAGPMSRSNVLVDRFLAVDEFQAMYDDAMADLRADLIDSGFAADTIDARAALLRDDASDLVDAGVVDDEAAVIREALGLS